MHLPPRLLILAAACGATVGAAAAWQIATDRSQQDEGMAASFLPPNGSAHYADDTLSQPLGAAAPRPTLESGAAAEASTPPALSVGLSSSATAVPLAAPSPPAGNASLASHAAPATTPALVDGEAGAYHQVAWGMSVDRQEDERLCVAGIPEACLRLAEAEAVHLSSVPEQEKARTHRERAYSILVFQCNRRNPDACITIARMHSLGIGVARDPVSERALLARATTLCKKLAGKVCKFLGP